MPHVVVVVKKSEPEFNFQLKLIESKHNKIASDSFFDFVYQWLLLKNRFSCHLHFKT